MKTLVKRLLKGHDNSIIYSLFLHAKARIRERNSLIRSTRSDPSIAIFHATPITNHVYGLVINQTAINSNGSFEGAIDDEIDR